LHSVPNLYDLHLSLYRLFSEIYLEAGDGITIASKMEWNGMEVVPNLYILMRVSGKWFSVMTIDLPGLCLPRKGKESISKMRTLPMNSAPPNDKDDTVFSTFQNSKFQQR